MILEIEIFVKQGKQPIGFDYHKKLHGWLSNLLGNDCYGKNVNDYTYSYIARPMYKKDGIHLKDKKGSFVVRTSSPNVLRNFLNNYDKHKDDEMFYGVYPDGFKFLQINNVNKGRFRTMVHSPILVNGFYDKKDWFDDNDIKRCEEYLVDSVFKKAKASGFTADENLSIKIKNQKKHSDIVYSGVHNKGRVFDLEINCNEETKEFILLNGLGRSCGIGFGMIY